MSDFSGIATSSWDRIQRGGSLGRKVCLEFLGDIRIPLASAFMIGSSASLWILAEEEDRAMSLLLVFNRSSTKNTDTSKHHVDLFSRYVCLC